MNTESESQKNNSFFCWLIWTGISGQILHVCAVREIPYQKFSIQKTCNMIQFKDICCVDYRCSLHVFARQSQLQHDQECTLVCDVWVKDRAHQKSEEDLSPKGDMVCMSLHV